MGLVPLTRLRYYLLGGLLSGMGLAQTAMWEKETRMEANPSQWLPFGPAHDIIPPHPDRGGW